MLNEEQPSTEKIVKELEQYFEATNPEDFNYSPVEENEQWLWERFKNAIPEFKKLKAAGYNPIAYTVMICEDTFVFATDDEAKRAHSQFEEHGKGKNFITGWWYGKDNFFKTVFPEYRESMKKYQETRYILIKPF